MMVMAKDILQLDPQLRALSEAARAITSELSLEQVLQKIAQAAQTLINARFAALGVHDGHGNLSRFITAGVAPGAHAQIGKLPAGRGLLGVFLRAGKSLIVNDVANHPAAAGFPQHHPVMRNLLGVPIYSKGELIGALYLADKKDGSNFTETDQQLIEMLALHAAIAIENAHLYEKTQRLAILEERERFARDLHDGIIQSIYAVGLSLDHAKANIAPDNEAALSQIDASLKNLANVINDIRNYIFDLRPHALKHKGLYARLEGLIKELKVNSLLPVRTEIDADINLYLTELQASHVFHIAHEALSNVARHAQARQIYLGLTKKDDSIFLQVEDDGIGFDPPTTIEYGHHGLANIQKRVALLNATLNIDSTPNQGTRLTVTIPFNSRVT
jgi:signal transduction histidine kinase